MRKEVHILNGDALRAQFPKAISGQIYVCRECLVDGNVEGEDLDQLFKNRASFLSKNYGGTVEDYFDYVVSEFRAILAIENSTINLWFEDDLFCQVNLWFVSFLLHKSNKGNQVYLIRPREHTAYGFGGLDESELISIYENRKHLAELDRIADLWNMYQRNATDQMLEIAKQLEESLPFVAPAVQAHIDRIPANGNLGRPIETLKAIMEELNTEDFGLIFREFSRREPIYGFGDLQVKRLYEQLLRQ